MTDVKEWLKENPINTDGEIKALGERTRERAEALRKEWKGKEPETKEEAKAIIQPLMKDLAKDLTDTIVRLIVKQAVKTAIEEQNAEQN